MHEGHRQRLIDKLINGKNILSDHEILEILLFFAIPRKNVNELSHKLLNEFGSLNGCLDANFRALCSIDGVGTKTAALLITVFEIHRRCNEQKDKLPIIFSFDGCKQMLVDSFRGSTEEKFVAFFLDKKGRILLRKIFCSHSHNSVTFDTQEFLKGVTARNPHSVVVCHNHLSGNCEPSYYDDKATEQLYFSLKLVNITLSDHIIVADENTFSYRTTDRLASIIKKVDQIMF